jgi:AbiTii
MSLLDEIQADATGVDVPVEVLLRKVLILATRLEHEPMKGWVHTPRTRWVPGRRRPAALPYRLPDPAEGQLHERCLAGSGRGGPADGAS